VSAGPRLVSASLVEQMIQRYMAAQGINREWAIKTMSNHLAVLGVVPFARRNRLDVDAFAVQVRACGLFDSVVGT
jgi:hypothetical protein